MLGRKRLACSFCGRSEAEVAKLVAGPKVYICDECVALASRIMNGDGPNRLATHLARPGFVQRLRGDLRRFLEGDYLQRSLNLPSTPVR